MAKKKSTTTTVTESSAEGNTQSLFVALKPIQVAHAKFKLRGLSSLLAHAWSKKAVTQMLQNQMMTKEEKKKAKENREPKNPQRDFEEAQYIRNGKHCFPSTALKKAMGKAASAMGINPTLVKHAVFIEGDFLVIHHARCVMREDMVNIGKWPNRVPDLRYRPEYQEWWTEISVEYRLDMITPEQLTALLQNAGFSVGIGEWRPEKDGQFGRFEVV